MKREGIVGIIASAIVAACSSIAPTPASTANPTRAATTLPFGQFGGIPVLGIESETPLTLTLVVNGQSVGTAIPGVGLPPIDFGKLPPFPWTVEARSPSGRVLTSMTVRAGDVSATTDPNGNWGSTGTIGRVDLSCGRITIFAGYESPSGPAPPPSPGHPGDCTP
jgi:hypothetical protein